MGNCASDWYTLPKNNGSITISDYNNCGNPDPYILPVTINKTIIEPTKVKYDYIIGHILLKSAICSVTFTVDSDQIIKGATSPSVLTPGCIAKWESQDSYDLIIQLTNDKNSVLPADEFIFTDIYKISSRSIYVYSELSIYFVRSSPPTTESCESKYYTDVVNGNVKITEYSGKKKWMEPLEVNIYTKNLLDPSDVFIEQDISIGSEKFSIKTNAVTGQSLSTRGYSIIFKVISNSPNLIIKREISEVLIFTAEFSNNSNTYKKGDIYRFNQFPNSPNKSIIFTRITPRTYIDNTPVINKLLFKTDQIRIPSITINSQYLLNGSDIGNSIFTIQDKHKYYHKTTKFKPNNTCDILYINEDKVKTTKFDLCYVKIVSVLGGIGATTYDKMVNIYEGSDFYQFQYNMIKYAMARFILSKILYGDFNVNYLLGKYYDQFLKDLNATRFCHFVELFTKGELKNYNQYFLFS